MLQPLPGQAGREVDDVRVPISRAEQLHRVRAEAGGAVETTMRHPRVAAALRQVLPAHHDWPQARVHGDVVVDVLRSVRIVVHEEATLAEADVLCYTIRKKIREKLDAQKTKFMAGAHRSGISMDVIERVWANFEPFARYGFNRAHAAIYGIIAYHTAYLKANYSIEYMTAVLSAEMGTPERVAIAVAECRRMGIAVLPPDVNESDFGFTITPKGIRFGLGAVKNVGQGAVESIIDARRSGGAFRSLDDFCGRIDLQRCNKRVLESLVRCGATPDFGAREAQLARLDAVMATAQEEQEAKRQGQVTLFDLGAALGAEQVPVVTDPVQVRGLGVLAARALPELAPLGEQRPGPRVQYGLDDPLTETGPGQIAGAVLVPGEVGVDAPRVGDPHRIRPGTRRVLRGDQEDTGLVGHGGGDHPEPARVVAQGRREDPARGAHPVEGQLPGAIERVADALRRM